VHQLVGRRVVHVSIELGESKRLLLNCLRPHYGRLNYQDILRHVLRPRTDDHLLNSGHLVVVEREASRGMLPDSNADAAALKRFARVPTAKVHREVIEANNRNSPPVVIWVRRVGGIDEVRLAEARSDVVDVISVLVDHGREGNRLKKPILVGLVELGHGLVDDVDDGGIYHTVRELGLVRVAESPPNVASMFGE